jgi:hypothetical protein
VTTSSKKWHEEASIKIVAVLLAAVLSGFGGAWAGTIRATWNIAHEQASIESRLSALEDEKKAEHEDFSQINRKLAVIQQNQIVVLTTLHAKYPLDVPTPVLVVPSYVNDPPGDFGNAK